MLLLVSSYCISGVDKTVCCAIKSTTKSMSASETSSMRFSKILAIISIPVSSLGAVSLLLSILEQCHKDFYMRLLGLG